MGGLENLSLIPGSVGASPMQNIGAYGVEIKDHFAWLDAVRVSDGALQRFNAEECAFGYRESVFKREERGKWILVQVAFDLDRESPLRMGYGAIEEELKHLAPEDRTHRDERRGHPHPTLQAPRSRTDWKCWVVLQTPQCLLRSPTRCLPHPHMPNYPQPSGEVKLKLGGSLPSRKPTAFTTGRLWCWCILGAPQAEKCGLWPKTLWRLEDSLG